MGVSLTSRIASLDRAPGKSCLFAKTSNVAPANLCVKGTNSICRMKLQTLTLQYYTLKNDEMLIKTVCILSSVS